MTDPITELALSIRELTKVNVALIEECDRLRSRVNSLEGILTRKNQEIDDLCGGKIKVEPSASDWNDYKQKWSSECA